MDSLETKIEELKASSGKLSKEVAKLDADMASNDNGREQATEQRKKEADAFKALEKDLTEATKQMDKAIDTLAEVGADQTLEKAAEDHMKFMAGKKSLLKLRSRVKEALSAASSFLQGRHRNAVNSFLQAPFTGTYTSQSGEVVGILKDMRDTFKANLASAKILEQKQSKAYVNFMGSAGKAFDDMKDLFEVKQKMLEENDDVLATKKEKLAAAMEQTGICEDFLAEMGPLCDAKTKEYNQRNMLRSSEDAAIAEALAILNSDSAFNLFGNVKATSSGEDFLQIAAARGHMLPSDTTRSSVLRLLQAGGRSRRLARIVALLDAGNPFADVLKEIQEMLKLIAKEAKVDKDKLEWCKDERSSTKDKISKNEDEIGVLDESIAKLDEDIYAPEEGLEAMIEENENSLEDNVEQQKEETEMRKEGNLAYQANIADLVSAEKLLSSAITVLERYYSSREKFDKEEAEEVKALPGEPGSRPKTWEDEKGFKGQSKKGSDVIEMLQFILEDTEKEESEAHHDEKTSQHEFEDLMASVKEEQSELQETLAKLRKTLAEKEVEMIEAEKTLKETKAVKNAAEANLLEIKPGCDFVAENYDKRGEHRKSESAALEKASELLKGTPAYKAAESEAKLKSLGSCRDICEEEEGRNHAKCKACLADVTVPGYCAGHPDIDGC